MDILIGMNGAWIIGGTKWNSYDCYIELRDPTVEGVGKGNDIAIPTSELYIEFRTAWSLPEGILNAIIDLYPELDFFLECVEEGGFFAGYLKYSNSKAEVNLNKYLWKEYARKIYGEDWWAEYVGDSHQFGECNDDGTAWFDKDGNIETEYERSDPDPELPSPKQVH